MAGIKSPSPSNCEVCAPPSPCEPLLHSGPVQKTKHRTPFGFSLPALRQMGRALTLCGKLSGRPSCVVAEQLHRPWEQVPLEKPLGSLLWRGLAPRRDSLAIGKQKHRFKVRRWMHSNEGTQADDRVPGYCPLHGTDQPAICLKRLQ